MNKLEPIAGDDFGIVGFGIVKQCGRQGRLAVRKNERQRSEGLEI